MVNQNIISEASDQYSQNAVLYRKVYKLSGKMEREIRVYETQNKTGNQILDAVLTNKAMICQNKEIELKFIVDGEALSFMDDMDVSALFGNMLDNAIESAEKQQEKQKRLIWLYVTRENSLSASVQKITVMRRYTSRMVCR